MNESAKPSNPGALPALLLAAVVACTLLILVQFAACAKSGPCVYAEDFDAFYRAARHLASGEPNLIYDAARAKSYFEGSPIEFHPFLNPPFSLPLFYPLGLVSSFAATVGWFAFQLLVLAASTRTAYMKELLATRNSRPVDAIALPLIFAPFVVFTILAGQMAILCAALFILVLSWRKSRPVLAGLALAILAIKPQVGILLPVLLLMEKNWRALLVAAAAVLALLALSLSLWGSGIWRDYGDLMAVYRQILASAPPQYETASSSIYMAARMMGADGTQALFLQAALSCLTFIILWRMLAQCRNEEATLLLLTTGTFLILPYSFIYDGVILALPALLLFRQVTTGTASGLSRIALMLLLFIPVIGVKLQLQHFPYSITAVAVAYITSLTTARKDA